MLWRPARGISGVGIKKTRPDENMIECHVVRVHDLEVLRISLRQAYEVITGFMPASASPLDFCGVLLSFILRLACFRHRILLACLLLFSIAFTHVPFSS